VFSFAVTLQNI